MTTTKSCAECGTPYQGRYNSRLCPVCKAAHARKHRKACAERRLRAGVAAIQSILSEPDEPDDQPRQLHQPQRVTWWNVRTGQIEERWE